MLLLCLPLLIPPPPPPVSSFPRPHLSFQSTPHLLPLLYRRLHAGPVNCYSNSDPTSSLDGGQGFEEELRRLMELLPVELRRPLETHSELDALVEVVMDVGRRPLARFPSGDFFLSDRSITFEDLRHATSQAGDFGADNRAGISRTLHRISAIRNRKGLIVGLTCRVGRAVAGSANLLRDLVKDGGSLLLIGPPGVGKTTIIREIARMLANDYKKRVMIVDTSNEIGGDGDIPHPGIGNARRLQVPNSETQHKVLIEAVENHMPQVIVIDEIGTKLEAIAASTIAQRGIQLVATAHGVTIENLIMNPSLEMLVGGIQSVTLGDEEASRRGVQKTVLERKGPSTFTCGAEIISKTELRVHRRLEDTVDALLAGRPPIVEVRKLGSDGSILEVPVHEEPLHTVPCEEEILVNDSSLMEARRSLDSAFNLDLPVQKIERSRQDDASLPLFVYGINETSVLQAIKQLEMEEAITITNNLNKAKALLALQSKLKKNYLIEELAISQGIRVFMTKTNTLVQITKALRSLVNVHMDEVKIPEGKEKAGPSEKTDALEEARLAVEQLVIPKGESVQLLPRPMGLISAQMDLIESFNLKWEIAGQEPEVSLRILPLPADIERNTAVMKDIDSRPTDLGNFDDFDNPQNGVARLPFLPD